MSPEKIVALVLLVSLMFHTGLEVNREHLRAVLSDYGLLGKAFLANFVLVPIYGLLVSRAFQLDAPIATGLLLMAICPGVPFVVLAGGRKKGGSLGLAVSLAFVLPLLSLVTVPITAGLVLPGNPISATSIISSLVLFQLLPLLIGMFVADRLPSAAHKLVRIMGLVVLVAVVALFAVLGSAIVKSIAQVYGSRGMFAMASVVVLSLITGWVFGGARRDYRRTLGVGTALRNIGLAAVLATSTFGGGLVSASVITYLIIQFAVVAIAGVIFTRVSKASEAAG